MMDLLEQIKEVIVLIISLVATLVVTISQLVKEIKKKKDLISMQTLNEQLENFIKQAEKYVSFSGEEKKEWVKSCLMQYAITNKITYNDEEVNQKIENLVELSKEVNKRERELEKL